jgi:hypothetical protein
MILTMAAIAVGAFFALSIMTATIDITHQAAAVFYLEKLKP